jgi:Ni,Fe-hydrogenase III large subunit
MAELERIANHLGDVGAICNDAAFALLHMQCGVLRETVLRASAAAFGHRLMMDRVVPGGVAADLAGAAAIHALVRELEARFPRLVEIYDSKPSLLDRTVSTGITRKDLVNAFGAGGHVGRAAGRNQDARRQPGYAPYDRVEFLVPVLHEGDVNARVWVRIREIGESLRLIKQILAALPDGPVLAPLAAAEGEGMALIEAFRGETLCWVRVKDGLIARAHLRDASWFQWPLLEHAILDNIVADFPLCNKSFNCSYSGHDV